MSPVKRQSKVKEHVFFSRGKLQEDSLAKKTPRFPLGCPPVPVAPAYLALARALSAALARGTALLKRGRAPALGFARRQRQTPNIAPNVSRFSGFSLGSTSRTRSAEGQAPLGLTLFQALPVDT